jgi:hypothetical protein
LANTGTGDNTIIGNPPTPFLLNSIAWRANDAANVVGGFDRIGGQFVPRVWTPEIGWTFLDDFLHAQGTWMEGAGAGTIQSMSADGRTWAVLGLVPNGIAPLIIEDPEGDRLPQRPLAVPSRQRTWTSPSRAGWDEHLAHGDTLGLCQSGGD